jgi:sugar transferase (PEP-CTERM/EpsH1 system associated)
MHRLIDQSMDKSLHQPGQPPLIAHVIHHLGVGGMENGLVNLINHIPPERYRHAIVCLKGYSDFYKRITRQPVEIIALNKREGNDIGMYLRLFRTLRQLNPDIVHTRNLATMEGQLIAAAARVRARVHGEHGRDIFDLHGANRKYNLLRKAISPFVGHFIAVSQDLESWLVNTVGVAPGRVSQIYSGVDSVRFCPRGGTPSATGPDGFFTQDAIVVGSVGRMAAVKDFPNLVRAFQLMLEREPAARARLRLLIVGEGIHRQTCIEMVQRSGLADLAWFPGERADIAELMRAMDIFVLPSLGEGISNTILEAMSTGLPVVATRVGGNVELIREGVTGKLVPPGEPERLAEALLDYYRRPELLHHHGETARRLIESSFAMQAMTAGYVEVYDKVLRRYQAAHLRNAAESPLPCTRRFTHESTSAWLPSPASGRGVGGEGARQGRCIEIYAPTTSACVSGVDCTMPPASPLTPTPGAPTPLPLAGEGSRAGPDSGGNLSSCKGEEPAVAHEDHKPGSC